MYCSQRSTENEKSIAQTTAKDDRSKELLRYLTILDNTEVHLHICGLKSKHLKIENLDGTLGMNKLDLIRSIADDLNLPQKDVKAIVNEFLEKIVNAVATGDKVSLQNFGSFDAIERKAREGRNPRNGEAIEIPSKRLPSFHAGREFKDRVNE